MGEGRGNGQYPEDATLKCIFLTTFCPGSSEARNYLLLRHSPFPGAMSCFLNTLVLVEADTHGFGHYVARGRLQANLQTGCKSKRRFLPSRVMMNRLSTLRPTSTFRRSAAMQRTTGSS